MPDTPTPEPGPQAPPPSELVDTTPATPERIGVTYGILLFVLAALIAYLVVRLLGSH